MKRLAVAGCLAVALIFPVGCKTATSTTPAAALAPGAVNQFDQTSYQTLLAIQATLNSLNASYKANPTGLAALKGPLDQAATDYNLAYLAWETYHSAATAANQAALTASLTKVQTDAASIAVPAN